MFIDIIMNKKRTKITYCSRTNYKYLFIVGETFFCWSYYLGVIHPHGSAKAWDIPVEVEQRSTQ